MSVFLSYFSDDSLIFLIAKDHFPCFHEQTGDAEPLAHILRGKDDPAFGALAVWMFHVEPPSKKVRIAARIAKAARPKSQFLATKFLSGIEIGDIIL